MVNGRTAGPPIAERGPRVSDVRSFELQVPVSSSSASADGGRPGWDIAATVYLPAAGDMPAPSARVLVVMPGGGYSRRYFDLPVPGYSQASHHARAGTVVVAID